LIRVSTHLRPTIFGVVTAIAFGAGLLVAAGAGLSLKWPLAGALAAGVTLLVIALTAWRTAQATAIVRRAVVRVTAAQQMVRMRSGGAHASIISPTRLRTYGLRSALIFVLMIVGIGTGTFMLQEAASAVRLVIGARDGGPWRPSISAWLDTPGGIAIAPNGDIYFADSNNDVIDRVDHKLGVTTFVGNRTNGFSGYNGPATRAQLDTPDGVAIAPDGDLIVADSHNDRIRRVDSQTRFITTIAGSGENGPTETRAGGRRALAHERRATARNGDIYIADTLNNRIRMIDHATGFIHTVAGDGETGGAGPVGDGGPATSAHHFMPSDVQVAANGDIYIAMHHNRVRKVNAATHVITTVAGTGVFGSGGDNGPAAQASLAGPAGLALVEDSLGRLTIFVADYYNGAVRAVDFNGILRNVSGEGRVKFGAPSRVAFAPGTGWLYVADASNHQVVALNIPVALLSRGRGVTPPRGVTVPGPRGPNRRTG
jgi:hypothetical protein